MKTDKILTYLGLAAAKRSVVLGTDLVLREIRKNKGTVCVLLAADASERTSKQITDKCNFYEIPLIRTECDMDTLGRRVGKISPTACAAVTDKGLATQIISVWQSE
ncbi:MAG: ribosomal L7Ae/L30e/S12e/Gadd45 family protein [Clostridia bacterium]|nr:ribosomal L7Ae/L30e/S12e/Gadd45 family protein [Clostridia bacterium]